MGHTQVILLDTNILIAALVPGSPEAAALEQHARAKQALRVSVMVWAEFLCGPLTAEQKQLASAIVGQPEPMEVADTERAADLYNATGRRRGSLADCLIAATCLRLDAPLMTSNIEDFARFQKLGLRLVM